MRFFRDGHCRNSHPRQAKAPVGKGLCAVGSATFAPDAPLYGYRHLSTELGRWSSRDPINEMSFVKYLESFITSFGRQKISYISGSYSQKEDLYVMANNSAVNVLDYLGLYYVDPGRYRCPRGQRWIMDPNGTVPAADGCSVPDRIIPLLPSGDPDNPTGFCPIRAACDNHDYCYSRCRRSRNMNTGRSDCDSALLDDIRRSCDRCGLTGEQRSICRNWAMIYYLAVRSGGGGPFRDRQALNCHCACP